MLTKDEGDVEKWKLELVMKFFGVNHQGPEISSGEEADLGQTGVEKKGFAGDEDYINLRRNKDVKIIDIEDSSSEDDDELGLQNKRFPDAEISEARKSVNSIIDLLLDFIPESSKVFDAHGFAEKVAGGIIDLVIDSVIEAEVKCVSQAKVEGIVELAGTIDASHVVFSCIDVRLKTGFPAPSPPLVKKKDKPRVVGSSSVIEERFKNVVAPPGEPVKIPDIEERYLVDGSDEEFCQDLAEKLKEEKVDMLQGLVKMLGRELVLKFFQKSQEVEASGGLLIMNGARRRTSGGVFLQLIRKTEDRTVREDVDKFFVDRQKEDERQKSARIAAVKEKNKKRLASELKEMLRAEKD